MLHQFSQKNVFFRFLDRIFFFKKKTCIASSCTYYVPRCGSTSLCDQNCGLQSTDRQTDRHTDTQTYATRTDRQKFKNLKTYDLVKLHLLFQDCDHWRPNKGIKFIGGGGIFMRHRLVMTAPDPSLQLIQQAFYMIKIRRFPGHHRNTQVSKIMSSHTC